MESTIVIKGLSIKIEGQFDIKLEEFSASGKMESNDLTTYLNVLTGILEGINQK